MTTMPGTMTDRTRLEGHLSRSLRRRLGEGEASLRRCLGQLLDLAEQSDAPAHEHRQTIRRIITENRSAAAWAPRDMVEPDAIDQAEHAVVDRLDRTRRAARRTGLWSTGPSNSQLWIG